MPFEAREAVMAAVERLDYRVTSAEVAREAGLPIAEAERCLQSLANECAGMMKVTEDGDLIYELPRSLRGNLVANSARLRADAAVRTASAAAVKAGKVAFGVMLVASIAVASVAVVAAIAAMSTQGSSDNRRQSRGGGGGGMSFFFDPWIWFGPNYGYSSQNRSMRSREDQRRRQERERLEASQRHPDAPQGFFPSAFSVVFGDPDPNTGFDEARWRAIGQRISDRGGVVAAEEVKPFCDLQSGGAADPEDESYMLPVLLRLNGQATLRGSMLLYEFPELQRKASPWDRRGGPSGAAEGGEQVPGSLTFGQLFRRMTGGAARRGSEGDAPQRYIDRTGGGERFAARESEVLTRAAAVNKGLVATLGVLNVGLVAAAASLLGSPDVLFAMQRAGSLGIAQFVGALLPLLVVYAASYVFVPLARAVAIAVRNQGVERGNAARRAAAQALESPSPQLREKLRVARRLGEGAVIDLNSRDVVYDTAATRAGDAEAGEWDQRFKRQVR